MLCQSLNIFIFELSALKVSSALAGLSAFRSGKFSVCSYLGFDLATVLLSRISELIRASSTKFSLFVICPCLFADAIYTFTI